MSPDRRTHRRLSNNDANPGLRPDLSRDKAMNKIIIGYFKSTLGELILGCFDEKLCLCDWRYRKMRQAIDYRLQKGIGAVFVEGESELLRTTTCQLQEYFTGRRQHFTMPLLTVGTPFQKHVWQELIQTPYGTTLSYRQLAEKIGNKKAVRAVAGANGANAISIIIPCHRIIGSSGELAGYAGGLRAKKSLLKLEKKLFNT